MLSRDDELSDYERRANVRSIRRVPPSILPYGAAKLHLIELARTGHDVYCYASGGEIHGTWCVWLENQRVPLADYVATYRPHEDPGGAA